MAAVEQAHPVYHHKKVLKWFWFLPEPLFYGAQDKVLAHGRLYLCYLLNMEPLFPVFYQIPTLLSRLKSPLN